MTDVDIDFEGSREALADLRQELAAHGFTKLTIEYTSGQGSEERTAGEAILAGAGLLAAVVQITGYNGKDLVNDLQSAIDAFSARRRDAKAEPRHRR